MTVPAIDPAEQDRSDAIDILHDAIRLVRAGDAVAVMVTLYYPGIAAEMKWSGIDDLDRVVGAIERQKHKLIASAVVGE